MLKYFLGILIIFIILYFLTILKQKMFTETFENGFKVNVLGASALEKVVSTVFDKQEKPVAINVNNTLGKEHRLVTDASHDISSDEITFSDNCPINLSCSEPPTKDEQAILDVYRNNLRREPDKLGFHYWLGRMKKGETIGSITQIFKNSSEYKQVLEGKDKQKFEELNNLDFNKSLKKDELNQCAANFDEHEPCCGNPKTDMSVEAKYVCPEETPMCSNYIANKNWGKCVSNGGQGNKVVVLGAYNMHPWNLDETWKDQKAKWIWCEKNADRVAVGSTVCKFEYKYYKHNPDVVKNYNINNDLTVQIHICADNYAYVYLNGKFLFTQTGGWPHSGIHKDIKITNGINHFEIIVVNGDISPNSAGLLMTVIGNTSDKEPLLRTDEKWSYTNVLPKPDTILLNYRKPDISHPPKLFNPLIALWNKKHKGFLKMDVDTSISQYTTRGQLSLMYSDDKKLPNSYDTEGTIFKFSRTKNWSADNTYSLYNCRNSRYIRTNGDTWKIDTSKLNLNQDLIESWKWERWIPVYNDDDTVSFKSDLWKERFLSVHDKHNITAKILEKPDDSCKWEVLNIDTIYFGPSNELHKNTENKPGFTLKIPSNIEYLGQYPINPQYYTEKVGEQSWQYSTEQHWNDTIMSYGTINVNNDWNITTSFRSDITSGDIGWEQPLQKFGIKQNDLKKVKPDFELIATGTTKEIVLTNDKILCLATNNTPYYRELYNSPNTSSYSLTLFENHGYGTSIIVGEVNNEPSVFMIGIDDYNYVYYRKISELHTGSWSQYNNTVKDLHRICFDKNNKQLLGLKKNKQLIFITSRTTHVESNLPLDFVDISILDKNVGTSMLLINKEGYLYTSELSKENVNEPILLDNKLQIKKVSSINNIVFAIGKNDGRLYFKPLSKIIPFRIYNSKLEGNLIDVQIYKDMLYVVNSSNDIMRCPIILS